MADGTPGARAGARADKPRELARALSRLGFASRSQATALIAEGRVSVNGIARRDPTCRVELGRDRIEVDGKVVEDAARVYLMLNKPRGLVTTSSDERGRGTVFDCLAGRNLPFVSAVGRLDQASEGLLLFTNDGAWAARLTEPAHHVEKTYHVQVDRVADAALVTALGVGVTDDGEHLATRTARLLRAGAKTSWLEVVLDEGKHRHLRRLLGALGVEVERLVRVAIGPLVLGDLAKGASRPLTDDEVRALGGPAPAARTRRTAPTRPSRR